MVGCTSAPAGTVGVPSRILSDGGHPKTEERRRYQVALKLKVQLAPTTAASETTPGSDKSLKRPLFNYSLFRHREQRRWSMTPKLLGLVARCSVSPAHTWPPVRGPRIGQVDDPVPITSDALRFLWQALPLWNQGASGRRDSRRGGEPRLRPELCFPDEDHGVYVDEDEQQAVVGQAGVDLTSR